MKSIKGLKQTIRLGKRAILVMLSGVFSVAVLSLSLHMFLAPSFALASQNENYFAIVNKEKIPPQRYIEEFQKGVRETFYHGKVTEKELEKFRQKVVKKLINEKLLLQLAKEKGINPRPEKVAKKIEKETAKYRKQKNWESSKEVIIASVKTKIEIEDVLDQLEHKTRDIPKPKMDAIKNYYKKHPDKFTAPEKWNVSIIMLNVDPTSPASVWQDSAELANDLVKKLRDGENFEELARIHSGDESAIDGGNMGYIHTGMLSKPAQEVLNTMDLGQISEPVMLLKGVAIFRLNGIQGTKLNEFNVVKERARNLLYREMQDEAWNNLVISLRKNSTIQVNEEFVDSVTTGPSPQS